MTDKVPPLPKGGIINAKGIDNLIDDEYFKGCSGKGLTAFAKGLLAQVDMKSDVYQEVVKNYAGDTRVIQVYEGERDVVYLSIDSTITVLNIVNKDNPHDMESIELC